MRRSYRAPLKPEKEFIHTYHVNEVPLPYYNPLEDKHLKHFFSNRKVSKHIEEKGFRYQPRTQYPYHERRTKNAYKFHRQNSPEIPSTHLVRDNKGLSHSLFLKRSKIQSSFFQGEEPMSPILKRKAQSQVFNPKPTKGLFLADIMTKKSNIQVRKKVVHSSEGRSRPQWFQKNINSSRGNQLFLDPENNA